MTQTVKGVKALPLSIARRALEEMGLRATRQRVALYSSIFRARSTHFSAEELYQEVTGMRVHMSLATIYNTLRQFQDAGMVREVASYDGKTWFDTIMGPHCHFYDVENRNLFDATHSFQLQNDFIVAPENTEVIGVDMIIRVKPIAEEKG